MEYDFSKVTIPMYQWKCAWAQCMEDGITRGVWVGDETHSFLVGHAPNKDSAMAAVQKLMEMHQAARVLTGRKP